jgi:hypothetical protein
VRLPSIAARAEIRERGAQDLVDRGPVLALPAPVITMTRSRVHTKIWW